MLAALLRCACRDAEVDGGLIWQHLETICRGDATVEEDVLGEIARQERQHLAEVLIVAGIAEEFAPVDATDDNRGFHRLELVVIFALPLSIHQFQNLYEIPTLN